MEDSAKADSPWPLPGDETYTRVVHGVLSAEEAEQQLKTAPSDGNGWFIGLDLNPIALGLLAASDRFAQWYAREFPERAGIVNEIRSMPEETAFREIRNGRGWRYSSSPQRVVAQTNIGTTE